MSEPEIITTYGQVMDSVRDELTAVYATDGGIDPDDFEYIGSEVAGRLMSAMLKARAT